MSRMNSLVDFIAKSEMRRAPIREMYGLQRLDIVV